MLRAGFAVAFALLLASCTSTANPNAPTLNPTTGAHPATWLTTHWTAYLANNTQCVPCHGSATTQPTELPVAGVTCFGCHHPNGPNHPSTWTTPGEPIPDHGQAAIGVAPAAAFDPTAPLFPMQGMASCVPCHGPLYNNPNNQLAPSCYSCHTTAPHPAKPWGANLGLPATQPRHDLVDQSNAPECAKCHAGGANSDIVPVTPAAAGTAPGCFNGTLCHNTSFAN
jgi:hypothetical protein